MICGFSRVLTQHCRGVCAYVYGWSLHHAIYIVADMGYAAAATGVIGSASTLDYSVDYRPPIGRYYSVHIMVVASVPIGT